MVRNCHKHIQQVNPRHPERARIGSGIVTNIYSRSTPGTQRKQEFGQELSQTYTAGQPPAPRGSKNLVRNCHKHIPQVNPRHPEEARIWSGIVTNTYRRSTSRHPEEARIWSGIVTNTYRRSTPGTQRKQEFGQELSQTYTAGQPPAPRGSKHLVRNCHKHIPQVNPRHPDEANIWSGIVTNTYRRSTPGTKRKQEFGQELSHTYTTGQPSAPRGSKNLVRNCHKHIPQINPRHPEEARIWSGIVTNIYSRSTPGTQRNQTFGQELSQTHTAGQPSASGGSKHLVRNCHKHIPQVNLSAPRGSKHLVRNCHKHIPQINPWHPEEARIWSGIVTNIYSMSTPGTQRKQEFGQELSQTYTTGQPSAPRESKHLVRNCHKHIPQINPRHPEEARIWSGIVTNIYSRSTPGTQGKQEFGQELSQTYTAGQPPAPRGSKNLVRNCHKHIQQVNPPAPRGSKNLVRNCHKHKQQVNPRHPGEARIWSGIVTNIYSRSTPGTQGKQEFGQELSQTYTACQPPAPRGSKNLVRNCHKHIRQVNPRHPEEARIWSGIVTNIYSRSTPGTQGKQEFGQELSQTYTAGQPSAPRESKNLVRNCHKHILQVNPRHPEEANIWSGIVTNIYSRSTLGIQRKQEFGQELSQTYTAGQPSASRGSLGIQRKQEFGQELSQTHTAGQPLGTRRKQEFGQELSQTYTTGQPSAPRESKHLVRNCHKHIPQINPRHPEEARIWSGIVTNIYSRSTPGTQRKQEFCQELSQTHTTGHPSASRGSKNLVRNCHKHILQVNPRHPEEARIWSGIVTNIYSRSTPGTQRKQEFGQELSQTYTAGQPPAPRGSKNLVRNCHKHIPQVNPRHPEEARIWSGIVTNTYRRSTLGIQRKQEFGQELSQTHTTGHPSAPRGSKNLVRNCHKHIQQVIPRHPEEARIWSGIVTNIYSRSTPGTQRKQTFGQELSQTHTADQPPAPRGSKNLVRNCHKYIQQVNPRHPGEARIWSGIVTNIYSRSTPGTQGKQEFGQELSQTYTAGQPPAPRGSKNLVRNCHKHIQQVNPRHQEKANIWSGIVTNTYRRSTLGTQRKQEFGQELSQTYTAGQPPAPRGSKNLVRNCHKHIQQVIPRHPEEARIWSGIVTNNYRRSTLGTQRKQEFGQGLSQIYTAGQPPAPRESKNWVRDCHKHIQQVTPRHPEEARIWSGIVTNIYSRSTLGTQRKQEYGQELSQTHTAGQPSASRGSKNLVRNCHKYIQQVNPSAPRGSKNLVRNCHKHIQQVNPRHPEEARIWSGIVTNTYSRSTPGTQRKQTFGQELSQTHTAGQPLGTWRKQTFGQELSQTHTAGQPLGTQRKQTFGQELSQTHTADQPPAPRGSKNLVRYCHKHIQQVNPRHPEEANIWSGIVTNTYRRSTPGTQRKQEFGQELSQTYTAGQPPAPRGSKNFVRNCHKHIQQVIPRHPEEARIWSGIVTNTYHRSTPGIQRKQEFGQELSQTHTTGQPSASRGSKNLVRNCHKYIQQVNPRHPEKARIGSGIVTNTYNRSTLGTQRKQEFGQVLSQSIPQVNLSAPRGSKNFVRNCHKHIQQVNPRHQEETRIWSGTVTNTYRRSTLGTRRKQWSHYAF